MSDAPTQPRGIDPARAGLHALLVWAAVALAVAVLVQIDVTVPAVGHLGSALVAVTFLYVPVGMGALRREDLADYGFTTDPMRRSLIVAGVAMAIVFPLFFLGYLGFYDVACGHASLKKLVPHGMCGKYHGWHTVHWPKLDGKLFEFCAVQTIVVALPEELFFRGFLLGLLEKRFPPKRRILGGGVGLALVLSAAMFAIIHLPKEGDPRALATFFPALLFGWMRSATGSILASTLTHAGSNIIVRLLDLSVLG